jgi:hypothetical protein
MLLQRIALCGVALAACTASAEQSGQISRADRELADALKGRVAGEPVDCIDTTTVNGPQIIDKDTLLYRQTGRTVWRNELAASCGGLSPMDTIIIELHGTRMCRNDMFRAVSGSGRIPGPYCRLGKFVPYRKVKS